MNGKSIKSLVLVTALGLSACSTPMRTFHIDAVNDKEESIRCLIVIENDWPHEAKDAIYTPADVPIEFRTRVVNIKLKEVNITPGVANKIPGARDKSTYKLRTRDIRVTYPKRLTFILVE